MNLGTFAALSDDRETSALSAGEFAKLRAVQAVVTVASAFSLVWFFNATLEDAHITFRYARNMALGWGFGVWNEGAPAVEGFTSTLWTLLIYAGFKLGLSPFALAKMLGWLAYVAAPLACCAAWSRWPLRRVDSARTARPDWLLYAAVVFTLYLPFSWYALSGMEATAFYAELTLLLLVPWLFARRSGRVVASVVLSSLLVVSRPEGVLLAAIGNLHQYVVEPKERSVLARPSFWGLGSAGAAILLLTAFRYLHFGEFVPNTYFAKGHGGPSHVVQGFIYVADCLLSTFPVALVVIFALVKKRRLLADRSFRVLLGSVLLYGAYMIKVGGDPKSAFPMWRHVVHLAPLWVFLFARCLEALFTQFRAGVLGLALALFVCDATVVARQRDLLVRDPLASLRRFGPFTNEPPLELFSWLAPFTSSDTLSAVVLGGQWPYYTHGRFIDMLGLTDAHVAKFGKFAKFGPVDSKTDVPHVLSRHPDVIDGYLDPVALERGACPPQMTGFRAEMLGQLIASPIFRDHYYFVTNAPYHSFARAIFVKDSFYERSQSAGMQAVRVTDTALYRGDCVADAPPNTAAKILARLGMPVR